MESIDKMIQTVEKLEQDSLMVNNNDSRETINSLKDSAILILPTIRLAKNDIRNFSYTKILENLEQKMIKTISRLESL